MVRDADGRRARAGKATAPLPLLIKIAPDLTLEEKRDIAEVWGAPAHVRRRTVESPPPALGGVGW